jgi:hypothetical protein
VDTLGLRLRHNVNVRRLCLQDLRADFPQASPRRDAERNPLQSSTSLHPFSPRGRAGVGRSCVLGPGGLRTAARAGRRRASAERSPAHLGERAPLRPPFGRALRLRSGAAGYWRFSSHNYCYKAQPAAVASERYCHFLALLLGSPAPFGRFRAPVARSAGGCASAARQPPGCPPPAPGSPNPRRPHD